MTGLYRGIENISESESSNPFVGWSDNSWRPENQVQGGGPETPEPPVPMPIDDATGQKTAQRKAVARRRRSSGRLSTILSQDETLG